MSVAINLSDDEALVLSAWLAERSETLANDHRPSAEDVALWNLEALLEKQLAASFGSDYDERLKAARARLLAV